MTGREAGRRRERGRKGIRMGCKGRWGGDGRGEDPGPRTCKGARGLDKEAKDGSVNSKRPRQKSHEKHPCSGGTASSQGCGNFWAGGEGFLFLCKMASWSRDGLSFHMGISKKTIRTEMPSSLVVASRFAPLYPSIATHPSSLLHMCASLVLLSSNPTTLIPASSST